MATRLMTKPSTKVVFLVALSGCALATIALFAPGLAPRGSGDRDGAGIGSATRPATRPATQPATAPAAGAEARPAADHDAAVQELLHPLDFPLEDYAWLLDEFYDGEWVDYAGLAQGEGRRVLAALVDAIARTDGEALDRLRDADYLAWLGNAYNILTLETIVRVHPIASIMDIDAPWDTPWTTAGRELTLDQIEHDLMRLQHAPEEERRGFLDARLHFIVNCASIGCPVIPPRPLRGATLSAQMDEGVHAFMGDPSKYRFDGGVLFLNQLMDWYGDDFLFAWGPGVSDAAADRLRDAGHDKPEVAAALGAFFADYEEDVEAAAALREGRFRIEWMEYDWGLNER